MKFYKFIYITLGFIFMGIGMIGVIIPLLPTTPLLILASVFFVKGSDRFDKWFRETKIYKNYAEEFLKTRSMTKKRKVQLMVLSDLMITIPFITINNTYVRIFIVIIVIIKYWYFIFKIKTSNNKVYSNKEHK